MCYKVLLGSYQKQFSCHYREEKFAEKYRYHRRERERNCWPPLRASLPSSSLLLRPSFLLAGGFTDELETFSHFIFITLWNSF
jgi:hypothetical protein